MTSRPRPLVLCILDGWGERKNGDDNAIDDGELTKMPALTEFIGKIKASNGTVHVMGLLSPGGVHSHQHQIAALANILADAGLPVAVHAFLDGRDTPPKAALGYLM